MSAVLYYSNHCNHCKQLLLKFTAIDKLQKKIEKRLEAASRKAGLISQTNAQIYKLCNLYYNIQAFF